MSARTIFEKFCSFLEPLHDEAFGFAERYGLYRKSKDFIGAMYNLDIRKASKTVGSSLAQWYHEKTIQTIQGGEERLCLVEERSHLDIDVHAGCLPGQLWLVGDGHPLRAVHAVGGMGIYDRSNRELVGNSIDTTDRT